jgi:predicted RNase H-like HicB family nuclease
VESVLQSASVRMKYRDILKMVEEEVGVWCRRKGASSVETMKYVVIYEKTNTGYSCYAPDLPGCIAAGGNLRETKVLMERAIEIHLAGMRVDGDPIPAPTTAAEYLEVPVS